MGMYIYIHLGTDHQRIADPNQPLTNPINNPNHPKNNAHNLQQQATRPQRNKAETRSVCRHFRLERVLRWELG